MCITSGKIKLELYVTPEELILIGKLLKGKVETIATLDGEGNPIKPPK